jgi:hypothetical protein
MMASTGLLVVLATPLLGAHARVRIDSANNFVYENGRQLLFHGVNVVEKAWPRAVAPIARARIPTCA